MRDAAALLGAWDSFYVMIGSAAAGLTGLMFVVISLVSDDKRRTSEDGVSTFSTPTVVHFSYALFSAALMSAPFRSLVPIAVIFGLAGIGGAIYIVRIALRTAKLTSYKPDYEDWAFNVILPLIAYALFIAAAVTLNAWPERALFAPAAGVVLLIFIGIHNAWDVVTFLAMGKAEQLDEENARSAKANAEKKAAEPAQ